MKISTRLSLAVYIPALMAAVVVVALIFSFLEMRQIQADGDTIRKIRSSITELNHFVFSYVLYHEERPKEQFLAEHDNLTGLIASAQFQNSAQQQLLDSIQVDSLAMKDSFLQLVTAYENSNPVSHDEFQEIEARLTGILLLRSYEADLNASLLRSLVDDGIRVSEIRTIGLILLVIVFATLPFTIVLSRTKRDIVSSLTNLIKGTTIVGSGNLDYKIEEKRHDEIGDLSRSFNVMTERLKTVTASKEDLEKEIEERKKAEEARKASEERFNKAFHSSPAALVISHLGDGTIVNANESFERLFGYNLQEIIGKSSIELKMFVSPEHRDGLIRTMRDKGSVHNEEIDVRRKNGEVLNTLLSSEIIQVSERSYLLTTLVDITERKHAEESLRQRTNELEAANKELEAFSYSVSHDLRAPLRTLDGFSEAVLEDYGDKLDETGKDYLHRIRNASQTMSQLIDDILKLSRISRAEMYRDQVNLSNLVKSITDELKAAQPDRQVEFVIVPEVTVNGDQNLLGIGLRNLLENAWKYTGRSSNPRIEFGAKYQNGEKVFFVRDNGVGFDMKYAGKLFQPFQRLHTSKEYPGSGIGLATVQRIIRRHGGRIWAESEVGKGTTFYITLG